MKVPVTALFLCLLVLTMTSAFYNEPKIPESVNSSPTCCLKHQEKPLPRKLVVGYRKALYCALPAIIFVTKKNREVCANPEDKWAQDYINDPTIPLLPDKNLASVTRTKNGRVQLTNSP
ncbi:C-C motif chemokine 16 [Fukomys damarensis]|uniref:C-C motif chemokine n=1 Tax=Fukomys damarensis TaxID=885580 RepID=A0A091EG22_FUKDA|nr:C-C motif chemokine 16 [Fukomys damarensis]KFO34366.1 C-C motif chemokine 16 [Fukomys damarensis]